MKEEKGYLILRNSQVVEYMPNWDEAHNFAETLVKNDRNLLELLDWNPVVHKVNIMFYEICKGNYTKSITYKIREA